ncbi:MAG TPA: HD domain-containing protein [Nitrolancea sp.]|nr:HD domain-containing protein [Nitrolancea sp.]
MSTTPELSRQQLIDLLRDLGISTDRLPDALALAEHVHGAQRRAGGGPYLEEHVYPITADVARYLAGADPVDAHDAALIAILHDTIEDSTDVTAADLADRFGPVVASGVETLSKPSKRAGQTMSDDGPQEARYVAGVAAAPRDVRVVKVFDRLNNLSAVHERPLEKRQQYLAETRAYYLDLARGVDSGLAQRMTDLLEAQDQMVNA